MSYIHDVLYRDASTHLNTESPLYAQLADKLARADRLDAAVAYAKRSGVEALRAAMPPVASRFVLGTGFALTDPVAVEELDRTGADVRLVIGSDELPAAGFHPKLYLIERGDSLFVFSGSGNLTAGGLRTNVEQYEEFEIPLHSAAAQMHRERFEHLWNMGTALEDLRRSGAWDTYVELAEARHEERERHEDEDQAAAQTMRTRLRSRAGDTLAAHRGDPGATALRLHTLLREATGIDPQPERKAYVMLKDPIGTTSIQRAGLEVWGDRLVLAVWPAELKEQAHAFYGTGRAESLLVFLDQQDAWVASPTPHLGFHLSDRRQRLYLTPRVDLREYVRRWSHEDLDHAGGHPRATLRADLWPWLIERGYASTADADGLPRFERSLGRRSHAHLRPGVQVRREWPLTVAEAMDESGRLVAAIRDALQAVLGALHEPSLASSSGSSQ
jgi:HKD family nuclease